MSDTSPKDQDALLAGHRPAVTERRARPRELLFDFEDAGGRRYRAELLDDGPAGVEAQITTADGRFLLTRRWPSRALAEAWADAQRRSLVSSPAPY